MRNYIIRRVLLMVPTLFILSLIIFGLMRVLPGDVALMIAVGEGGDGAAFDEASLDIIREKLGLLDPLPVQYLKWMGNLVRGNLGDSLRSGQPIADEIFQRMSITVQIAMMATLYGMILGIPIGIISAVKRGTPIDFSLRFMVILFLTAPSFWLGLMVILGGAYFFQWVPPLGYNVLWENPKDNLLQLMWPVIILGNFGMASSARMTRSTMLEVLREDYIRTARSKGLAESRIIIRHALKNALIPVITLSGLTFAAQMGGTVILELIFGIPGMGSWFIDSIINQDYPIVQALVVQFAIVFMTMNLIIDLLYGWLDPRISYA